MHVKRRMGAGRKTQPVGPPYSEISFPFCRNLRKNQLGGVIFGCKNSTLKECLSKQLFGLPALHYFYVKNIEPGLPLFLFNYSDRKIHGIFEAASKGQMYIDHHAWSVDCSEITQYPAQVKVRVRLQCQPLSEDRFGQIIKENYFSRNHFWFELDHIQANKLNSLLVFSALAPATPSPQSMKWRAVPQPLPSHETPPKKGESFEMPESEAEHFTDSSGTNSIEITSSLDGDDQLDTHIAVNEVKEDEKDLVHMKLKALSLGRKIQDLSLPDNPNAAPNNNSNVNEDENNNQFSVKKSDQEVPPEVEKNEESLSPPFEYQQSIEQMKQEFEELATFKKIQTQKSSYLERKLIEATLEIQHLKDRCIMLESACNLPLAPVEKIAIESSEEMHLDNRESLFLIGGFDGESWLSAMDLYWPSQNVVKSLKPMSIVRSYSSVVKLNGEIYVFGGGDGNVWYDTVESYSPFHNEWTSRPSLNQKKGCLAGAALSDKIFSIGGGDGDSCFSDVEMLDLEVGRWISTRSMLNKRFAVAAAELNGALYVTGGYNGVDYLKSAERFDPREHSWTKIPDMNTRRGCHSMVVLNGKLHALGGFDGSTMVSSVEVFDPRREAWITGEQMNQPRGYFAAAVVKETIHVIGGVKVGENIVERVENYKEDKGWQENCTKMVGKRCFCSAIAL
ncbi:Kelch-like protein [Arachis hypogaea]|nr:Kelch-like protein [Arachis hypogaea]